MTRACIPHLKSGAAIVNVSSICGLRANARIAIYNAAKFGVTGFTQSMALELGPKGIRVNAVAPGQIHTPTNMNVVVGQDAMDQAKTRIALGRMGTPEEVADVVSFLFSEESRYVNGSVLEISGAMGS
jgi:NAD(P)-dependent dehydrogenase (short-subunit alcohol dehydrogenase family)